MDIMTELDVVQQIKEEYLKGDIVMSELLRNPEYDGLTDFSKNFLIKWTGEGDYVMVKDGQIIVKEEQNDRQNTTKLD